MADMLYIKFLNRLYRHCIDANGCVDIQQLVTDMLPYDLCFAFIQCAEQDTICTISVMYDNILIYLTPEIYRMNQKEYNRFLRTKYLTKRKTNGD